MPSGVARYLHPDLGGVLVPGVFVERDGEGVHMGRMRIARIGATAILSAIFGASFGLVSSE